MGWEVHVASRGDRVLPYCDVHHEIPISRSPFSRSNLEAFRMLKKVMNDNKFDIVHCHTPMGGVLTRLAADRKNSGTVIYTAHGFHFYKGAPLMNWLVYYPIEFLMSFRTDCLITINGEDYAFAKKHFRHPEVKLVDGVGYNDSRYFPVTEEEKKRIRKEKGFGEDEKILIYVAEMNENKNQGMLIDALKDIPDAKLLIAGADNYGGRYVSCAKTAGVADRVSFLGHCDDVADYVRFSDVCVASSLREGLPVNIMEAMACGLPVVATDNRGHRALIKDGEDGFIVKIGDSGAMAQKVRELLSQKELYCRISSAAAENVKRFSQTVVSAQMSDIYMNFRGLYE